MRYCDQFGRNFWERHQRMKAIKDRLALHYYSVRKPYKNYLTGITPGAIPIFINNFNRLESLEVLIEWLNTLEQDIKIIVIDNHSTYPPLLEYYRSLEREGILLIPLGGNYGTEKILPISCSLSHCPYFVVTDPDLVPYSTTPRDVLEVMMNALREMPGINHVGASLEINDIPSYFPGKQDVVDWEERYWQKKIKKHLYLADVATTFAMYRQNSQVRSTKPAVRLDRPYTLKHVDWYHDPAHLSEEYCHYLQTCNRSGTWAFHLKKNVAAARHLSLT